MCVFFCNFAPEIAECALLCTKKHGIQVPQYD